jgi:hypothetical protein
MFFPSPSGIRIKALASLNNIPAGAKQPEHDEEYL